MGSSGGAFGRASGGRRVPVGLSAASRGDLMPALRALIDPITGLANAQKLHADLTTTLGDGNPGPAVLYVFRLEGFRAFNDAYGEALGDAWLAWLARKLRDALGDRGVAYRPRGAGFAVLAAVSESSAAQLRDRCAAALHESGEGFAISCVAGAAALPAEAGNPQEALDLAARRAEAEREPREVRAPLRATAEPIHIAASMRAHHDLAAVAARIGRRLGVPDEQLGDLQAAVRLRDVGNVAVPRAVLAGAGELPGHERQFILRHTVVGERLLAARSGMQDVAELVRSSCEHFDGSGYPDGLAGEQIPLGSRIVFVCGAFEEMTSIRRHRCALDVQEALAEVERDAGTQFDPAVVRVFQEEIASIISGDEVTAPPCGRRVY
jgi:two-component system, cell cycle response regulator